MFSQLTQLSAQYVKIGENTNQYTADATTNHIFTMTKSGGNYDAITINVSLNKATFNLPDNSQVGWGTGNAIPADWDFEITDISVNPSTISGDKKSFTFSGNPPQNVTATIRVFDGSGTLNGLGATTLTYRLESIFTETLLTIIPCTGELKIVVNEVVVGASKPCAGTAGDPKYNIKVYNFGTTNLVTEKTQSSNEFILDLPIGGYDYVITDGCGRTHTSFTNISDKPEFGADVIFSGKECSTDATAKAVLRLTGAKRPITWKLEKKNGDNWDLVYNNTNAGASASSTSDIDVVGDGAFTISLSNIVDNGDYRFNFTDANLCTNSALFTVSTPSDLSHNLVDTAVATKKDLNCNGDVDGKLTFTGSGGWTQPFAGNNINPVNWGSGYTFTLINADTGAEVGVVTSNSWFNYAKNNANEQIGWEATFDNLPPGNYKLKLKENVAVNSDANPDVFFGCEVLFNDIYTIVAPPTLVIDGTKTDISCFGDDDGIIDLTISGGTPAYTIAWTKTGDGSFNASSEDLTGLAPGEYNVTVTDSKNCSQSTSFTIVEPAQLSAELDTTVATAIDCFDNNGVIKADITVSSTAPFTYVINGTDYNNNNVSVSSGETTNTSHNFSVKAGVYTVTVTDSRGCAVTTGQRTLTQPASGMTVTGTVSADFNGFENGDGLHMSCNGGTNGEIDLTVSGGTAGYTYAWTAVSGSGLDSTSQDQTGLTAGVYEVVVTDNTGCTISRRYVVSDPAPLTIPINDMAPGDKGNYTYLGELGTSKYYLSDATLTYMEARDIAANLGGYLVSIKTQAENQWLIDNSSDQNFWLGLDDIREESKVLGVVDKTKYRWNDGTSLDWEGFPAGEPNDASKDTTINSPGEDYIEFSNGSWNDIFHHVKRKFVIEFNPTQIPDFNGSSISCFGGTNGSIDFVVTGGTTPYTYAWTTADGSGLDVTSKSQTGLGAGTYSVTVTDSTGCTKSIDYTITQPDELQMSFDNTVNSAINCFGDNGTLKVDISQESVAPYTYLLEGTELVSGNLVSQSLTDQTVLTQTYNTLKAGTYKVTITDANGCVKVTPEKSLTQPAAGLSISEVVSVHNGFSITCNGASDGSIDLTVAGGAVNYTYAWTTTDGSGLDAAVADQTGLGPGTYKVVVTDNNLCTIEKTYTLTEPTPLAITEIVSSHNGFEITCNGANDASIDITASGGTSVYTYAWTTADGSGLDAAVADQTGLGPGTYKVEISDSNNCKIDKTYTISEPDPLSLSQSSSDFNGFDASCSGGVDATIDLTITGGAPTYSYAWTTTDGSGLDATAEDQSGLSAGTYDVIVTDLNGCQISDSFLITEPPPIVLTSILSDFNGFNISCNGESDGSIDITVSGGTISGGDTDYTYEWTTLNGTGLDTSVPDQTGLSAGTYTVKITDSNNCSLTRSIDILQADPIDLTGVLSDYNGYNVSVKGLADGFINITPVGGSGGYIYEWSTADGSGLIDGEQDQTGLTIGTYTLKLTDSNGCSTSKSFTLVEPTELTIDLGTDPTNILCFGEKTGVLKAIITQESVPSYKYTLNGTDYQGNVILETVSSITVLNHTFLVKAGIYTITVEDLNGGKKTSAQRTFTQPAAPLAISETISDFNGFNISCTGASDAAIDLTVIGGTITGTLYNYSWSTLDGSGLQPNIEDQIGLGPGTYTVLVEDENGCTVTKTYIITEPELIDYKLDTKNDISCFGANDGSINITVTKGTGVYNYAWTTEDGAGLDPTAEDQSGLSAGKYKLILTDGCQTLQYIYEIEEPAVLAIGLDEKVDILCFGDSTGKILVTVSGGTSPYNYEWIDNFGNKYNRDIGNVFNTGNLSNIPVGIYDLTVTDKNGCIETLKVELKEPDELKIDFNKVDVSCFKGNDGSIDVNPTGGVAPYTYSWSDFGNGKLRTDLVSGKYTVTVTDSNNCEKSVEIELKSAPQFNITSDVSPITCFGANDGSIKLTIDGGKAPVSLEWADDPQAGTTRSNLKSGVYSVLLKDSSGCEINEIYTITEPAKLQLSAIKSDALDCDDPNSGSIDLQVIGGNPPFTYVWSNGDTTEDLSDVSANNYSVIVTDSKGCTVEKTFSIVRPFELKIDLTSNLRVVCETRDVYLVNKVTIEGGVFPYTVKWSSGDVSGSNGEIMETNVEGSYSVEVTDNNGCTKTQIFDVVLPKLGYPEFDYTSFYWQTFGALTFNDPITFTNNSTESFLSVSWDFGDGNSSDQNDPVHSYEKKGSYDVTLYVTYFSGCIYEIKKTIYVGDSYEIEFPNAFTPNGDGLNDTFRPVYYGFKSVDLQVFDTWGTLIYSETAKGANIMNGWNGMLNGKPATNGNYIFQVSGEAFNGETVLKNGPFTLLR
ncbi:MAG: PKD domain-containing protein [Cryomorphaceae bacterium]|nr:MAG: PKD domain-containing protein [Cryomorphaceae bacterium]